MRIRSSIRSSAVIATLMLGNLLAIIGCRTETSESGDAIAVDREKIQSSANAVASRSPASNPASDIETEADPRSVMLDKVAACQQNDNLAGAMAVLQSWMVSHPNDAEVTFRLSTMVAADGDLATAITLLDDIDPGTAGAGPAALGQSADYAMALERFDDAADRYQRLLTVAPTANIAKRRLAYLYNRMGRRYEAAALIRELCASGDVLQDELLSLISVPDAMFDEAERAQTHVRHYVPIGRTGQARRAYSEQRLDEAADLLRREIDQIDDVPPSVWAFYGRVLAEKQDDAALAWWWQHKPADLETEPEYWAAIGTHWIHQRRFEPAIAALAKAYRGEPSDMSSVRRLRQAFLSIADSTGLTTKSPVDEQSARQAAEFWGQRYKSLKYLKREAQSLGQAERMEPATFESISERLNDLDRSLEALMWYSAGLLYQDDLDDDQKNGAIAILNQDRLSLLQTDPKTLASRTPIDELLATFVTVQPTLAESVTTIASSGETATPLSIVQSANFANVAEQWSLDHRYRSGGEDIAAGFAMYQQIGGGVAVVDYDRDGLPDLYLAQGSTQSNVNADKVLVDSASNQLWRNQGGRLASVHGSAHCTDASFSNGVTGGDWNQDGFDDLAAANIGDDFVWINQGDGTFRKMTLPDGRGPHAIDSSIAIADVTGDGMMDVTILSYVDDEKIYDRPEVNANGTVTTSFGPQMFDAAGDHVWVGRRDGGCDRQRFTEDPRDACAGLGLVINAGNDSTTDILIGNDGYPNHYWRASLKDMASQPTWVNLAALQGCAFGRDGTPTASMGIATADFNGDQSLDYVIANFGGEPNSVFVSDHDGGFRDQSQIMDLDEPSRQWVGFGAQSIDYDNNGQPDLAVSNGHIDAIEGDDVPLSQPFQLFGFDGRTFQTVTAGESSSYVDRDHVGRAMATLDINQDGAEDLIITHLFEPTAILENRSKDIGNYLRLDLVGVDSTRDAVGAKVIAQIGDVEIVKEVTAGDGFLCRNESTLHFGLDQHPRVDSVRVYWPSGSVTTRINIVADQAMLIVEGDWAAP